MRSTCRLWLIRSGLLVSCALPLSALPAPIDVSTNIVILTQPVRDDVFTRPFGDWNAPPLGVNTFDFFSHIATSGSAVETRIGRLKRGLQVEFSAPVHTPIAQYNPFLDPGIDNNAM